MEMRVILIFHGVLTTMHQAMCMIGVFYLYNHKCYHYSYFADGKTEDREESNLTSDRDQF